VFGANTCSHSALTTEQAFWLDQDEQAFGRATTRRARPAALFAKTTDACHTLVVG